MASDTKSIGETLKTAGQNIIDIGTKLTTESPDVASAKSELERIADD